MTAPRRIAALTAACLALSPAAALAQGNGAGDEQYSDPFSETNSSTTKPKQQSTPTPSTAQPVPHQQVQSSAPAASAPAQQSSGQLPRTGFDVVPLAVLGVALIGAGVLLLRRRRA